jgi:hypothetical protein
MGGGGAHPHPHRAEDGVAVCRGRGGQEGRELRADKGKGEARPSCLGRGAGLWGSGALAGEEVGNEDEVGHRGDDARQDAGIHGLVVGGPRMRRVQRRLDRQRIQQLGRVRPQQKQRR